MISKVLIIASLITTEAFHVRPTSIITRVIPLKISKEAAKDISTPLQVTLAGNLVGALFSVKPLWKYASGKAREGMVTKGASIGVDWVKNSNMYNAELEQLTKIYDNLAMKKIVYPDYYCKPFHAYDDGNLSWQAAFEVESAALTVHAPIFTKDRKELDITGDFVLRDNFHKNMLKIFESKDFRPKRILDVGCSTGLSTLKLHESFPSAEIIGLDLSPFMVATAIHNINTRASQLSAQSRVTYLFASGEDTGLGPGDADLVTMSLISHELPADVSRQIFEEAYRIIPLGGAISIMDINPRSAFFQKFAANPFAFAAFKSTEPWLDQYVSMDLESTLRDCGFQGIEILENSKRHRTVVAYK
eukprot:CAMPEP_0119043912 /NCGR_PEP_ID=MMETSP1177-20130426/26839_1 /TAXON_ID=2985 /ORGANISM="Ochromonas sp, Strain CCMP1899" /LENGTH=359 /DNA_ID=CAMNT_0007013021 /DNA_START=147 /DNA_END=1226 /DNA_ORIENTATION=-